MCQKKVVFGSVVGEAWSKLSSGEWILGGRPPATGKLGDCPTCGVTLEWEPGEEELSDPGRNAPPRVHLSALREAPVKFDGRDIYLRALVLEHVGSLFLSDSWRNRSRSAEPESDLAMLERLSREQTPRISATFATRGVRDRFHESARRLDAPDSFAAWIEAEGLFRAPGLLALRAISSIWPPKD